MGSGNSKGAGGFRVFRIVEGGPASEAGLEIFFDFVVEVNGVVVESDKQSLALMIKDQEGKRVKLTVYNCRTQALRDVYMIPRNWGGQGLLGLVVKFDYVENGENQGLRVLEIQPDSPAAKSGLISFKDFIIGSGDVIVRDAEDLAELVGGNVDKDLPLTVYNTDTEAIRIVTVRPHRGWGGDGLLGFATGSGVLHRIPMARKPLNFSDESQPSGAPLEPMASPECTDPTSPVEPTPTPPIPNLVPVSPWQRPDSPRNQQAANQEPPPKSPKSPKHEPVAIQKSSSPKHEPAVVEPQLIYPQPTSIPQEPVVVETPMSPKRPSPPSSPIRLPPMVPVPPEPMTKTDSTPIVLAPNVIVHSIATPVADPLGYAPESAVPVIQEPDYSQSVFAPGPADPVTQESDYSQSVAEAFGLVPPANTEENESVRRSSEESGVLVPDIAKLFD